MKRKTILIYSITMCLICTPKAFAYTKDEVEKILHDRISDEEYELIIKESESSGKSLADVFDEIINPMRDKPIKDRQYIQTSEKRFQENTNQESEVSEEAPIAVKQPKNENKPAVYNGEKVSNDKKLEAKQKVAENTSSSKLNKENAPKEKEDKQSKEDKATIEKKSEEVDRKAEAYRSYDRRKKIEDYNRTKKKNKFGGKRLDEEEVPDEGFATKAFKKKEFGTKVISDHKSKRFDGPDEDFEKKGFKRKIFRSGTYTDDDRKTSMFGKDEEDENKDK